MLRIVFILPLILLSFFSPAQVLQDSISQRLIIESLDYLYNYEIAEAEKTIRPVYEKYKNHPASNLLKANMLYWQYMPIENHPKIIEKYVNILEEGKSLAEDLYEVKGSPETIFYLLSVHGFLSRGYHYQSEYFKAGMEAKRAYSYLKDGFDLSKNNPDFYYSNGLYKFYRVAYPEIHPEIRPIVFFFEAGDKEEGMADLRKAGKLALFTKVESLYLLSEICLKYESRFVEALEVSRALYQKYPCNPSFQSNYIEALIANDQLEEASALNSELLEHEEIDFQMAHLLFAGNIALQELKYFHAISLLEQTLSMKEDGRKTDEYRAMILLSLGKTYRQIGQKEKAKEFLKECLDKAVYKSVIAEAKEELKKL